MILCFGSPQLGDVDNSDHDQRFFFDKSKAAFRAGDVKNDNWDDANVGNFSVAFGKDTKASGKASFALGRKSQALGDYSFAVGDDARASLNFSLAIGNGATSDNIGAIAIGETVDANGLYSAALGYETTADGIGAVAVGYNTNVNGIGAIGLGYQAAANNDAAIAIGYDVTANGFGSVALGRDNTTPSAFETTLGYFATDYTPNNVSDVDENDRLFTIGNGTSDSERSDALVILKNGNTFINGALTVNNAFTFPESDGSMGQILVTDGNGNLSWVTLGGFGLQESGTVELDVKTPPSYSQKINQLQQQIEELKEMLLNISK